MTKIDNDHGYDIIDSHLQNYQYWEYKMGLKRSFLAGCLGLVLLTNTGHAQTPSDESLARYEALINFQADFEQGFINSLVLQAKSGLLASIKEMYPNATHQQIAAADAAINSMIVEQAKNTLNQHPIIYEIVHRAFMDATRQGYTQAEIDAMNEFYATPLGQSIVKKQLSITTSTLNQIVYEVASLSPAPKTDDDQWKKAQAQLFAKLDEIFRQ